VRPFRSAHRIRTALEAYVAVQIVIVALSVFALLCFGAARRWRPKIFSCVSSWPCSKNVRRRPQGPHRSLGPVFPTIVKLPRRLVAAPSRFHLPSRVIAEPIPGGLHHEYRWGESHEFHDRIFAEDTQFINGVEACENHNWLTLSLMPILSRPS
jgi:hypothetical protein